MKSLNICLALFLYVFVNINNGLSQISWLVDPVIEQENFHYDPDLNESYIILLVNNRNAGIQHVDGSYLCKPGTLVNTNYLGKHGVMYAIYSADSSIIFNSKGKILSNGYDNVNFIQNSPLLMTKKHGLFGLIDTSGKIILKTQFKNLIRSSNGIYTGTFKDEREKIFKLDESAKPRMSFLDRYERSLNTRKTKNRIIKNENIRWQQFMTILNFNGDTVLKKGIYARNTTSLILFDKGLLVVYDSSNRAGVINDDGEIIIPCTHQKINENLLSQKYFIAKNNTEYSFWDFEGNLINKIKTEYVIPFDTFPYFCSIYKGKYSIFDINLTPLISDSFTRIDEITDGNWTLLQSGKKFGFYSFVTNKYSPIQFNKIIGPYRSNGVNAVTSGNLYGLYDINKGHYITDTLYNKIKYYGNYSVGTIHVKDSIWKDSVFKFYIRKDRHLIDAIGQILLRSTHSIYQASPGIFAERTHRDTMILHNVKTNQNLVYSNSKRFRFGGNIAILNKGEVYYIDDLFLSKDPKKYEGLSFIKEHLYSFKVNGKYGILHDKKIVFEPILDEIKESRQGKIKVKKDGKWGILKNSFNKEELTSEYLIR